MSISALSSTSAASALSFLSRLSSTNSTNSASSAGSTTNTTGVRPPPPPPKDGGGFADAIAEALASIGISEVGTDSSGSAAASSAEATDASADANDVAAALGSFLQSLMGALHAQHSDNAEAPPPYGEQQGGAGGPGKLESDLQSLIAEVGAGASSSATDGSDSADAVDQLESAFANLLDKLGAGTDASSADGTASTDSTGTDAASKLAAFLQALSAKVGGSGVSGNLVNTTV
ncbi:hypothetical protein [Duganella sp. BuS-21]|uniref:hypothetical protein n=1 Tax=Duganella sp. BuS-21 TaxID=2943848 RepID=UPI0035A64248